MFLFPFTWLEHLKLSSVENEHKIVYFNITTYGNFVI